MSKLLKFTAKMQNGSLKANFMGNQRSVDADAEYVYNQSNPQGQAKSFEFSFDDKGKLLANATGSNPFNLVVNGPTNPSFQPVNSGDKVETIEYETRSAVEAGSNIGGACNCPKCSPCAGDE